MSDHDDAAVPPRPPPRFVPTLTEVVSASPAAAATPLPQGGAQPAGAASAPVSAELAELLLRQLGPELEQRIQQAVRGALHEQMRGFETRLLRHLSQAVQAALAERMTQDKKNREIRANP